MSPKYAVQHVLPVLPMRKRPQGKCCYNPTPNKLLILTVTDDDNKALTHHLILRLYRSDFGN